MSARNQDDLNMTTTPESPFKVIVAGGGLVGLTAAHILTKAKIDFVVLEKHTTVIPTVGSTMTFWPQTFRVFEQLGLNDAFAPILETLKDNIVMSADDATEYDVSDFPSLVEKNHGWGFRVLVRTKLAQTLYDTLSPEAKSRILLGKQVQSVETHDDGVRVLCQDGSIETGSILIGADGVRSQTRLFMESLRQDVKPTDLAGRYQRPYVTTYRVLVGHMDTLPGVSNNIKCDGIRYGVTTQLMYGTKMCVFAIYEKLTKPTSEHHRYTDKDKEKMIERWGHLMVVKGYSVSDCYKRCVGEVGLYDCEEGLVKNWHHGRIVLVGDAVRKLDPHAGVGYNEGVTDVVTLVNGLRQALKADSRPSTAKLETLFSKYGKAREKNTEMVSEMSKAFARMAAWLSWKDMVMGRYVQPYLPLDYLSLNYVIGPLIRGSPVLDWLPEPRRPASALAYKNHPKDIGETETVVSKQQMSSARKGKGFLPVRWAKEAGAAAAAVVGHKFHWRS